MDEINHPPSPCVGICVIDRSSGFCLGCARTSDEITLWASSPPERKRAILTELKARRGKDTDFDYEQFLK